MSIRRIAAALAALLGMASAAHAGSVPVSSGLSLHLAADAITGVSDGGSVELWADQSGKGNDAASIATASAPTFQQNVVNGLPVVRFGGSHALAVADYPPAANQTIFVVTKGSDYMSLLRWQSGGGYYIYAWSGQIISNNNLGGFTGVNTGLVGGEWNIGAAFVEPGVENGLVSYRNGALVGKNTWENQQYGNSLLHIGCREGTMEFCTCDIAEILVYDRILTPVEHGKVGAYLQLKYAIAGDYGTFVLASPVTGNTSYTATNAVKVADLPPIGSFTQYQITAGQAQPDPDAWAALPASASAIPAIDFERPAADADLTFTLWLRQSADDAAPESFEASISFVANPVPVAIAKDISIVVDSVLGTTITPQMVDDGSYDAAAGIASMSVTPSVVYGPTTVTLNVTSTTGATASDTAMVSVQAYSDVHASPSGSDDTGDGSPTNPYRTITKALAENASNAKAAIYADAGLYDEAAGEVFPITPLAGQSVVGAYASDHDLSSATVIDAGGAANAIVLPSSATAKGALRGVVVTNALNAIYSQGWQGDLSDIWITDVAQGETYSIAIYGDNTSHAINATRVEMSGIVNQSGQHLVFFLAGGGTFNASGLVVTNILSGTPEWGWFHFGWHGGASWNVTVKDSLFADIDYNGGNNNERGMIQVWGGGCTALFDRCTFRDLNFNKCVFNENRTGTTIIRNCLFRDIQLSQYAVLCECYGSNGMFVENCTFHDASPIFYVYGGTKAIEARNCSFSASEGSTATLNSYNDPNCFDRLRIFNCNLYNVEDYGYDKGSSAAPTKFEPSYANAENGDFSLNIRSKLIDAGDTSVVTDNLRIAWDANPVDFAGRSRIFDGDSDGIANVDIGAFEFVYGQTTTPTFTTVVPMTHLFEGETTEIPVFVNPAIERGATGVVTYGTNLLSGASSIMVPAGGTNVLSVSAANLAEDVVTWIEISDADSPAEVDTGVFAVAIHPKKVELSVPTGNFLQKNDTIDIAFSLPGTARAPFDIPFSWTLTGTGDNDVEWIPDDPSAPDPAISEGDHTANGILRVTGGSGKTEIVLLLQSGYIFAASGDASVTVGVTAHPGYLYVSPDGSDETGDGTIDHPMQSISRAVSCLVDGQSVYMLPGVYDLSTQTFPIYVSADISLVGCDGDGLPTDDPSLVVVDGAATDDGGVAVNTLFRMDKTAPAIVANMTLAHAAGGAVYCDSGVVKASNCVFRDNTGTWNTATDLGVATCIALVNNACAETDGCVFEDNVGRGAIGADRREFANAMTISATNCVFRGNSSRIGTVYIRHHYGYNTCWIDLVDCVFTNNAADFGNLDGSKPCAVSFTTVADGGANVHQSIRRCLIADNSAPQLFGVSYSTADIRDCLLLSNRATEGIAYSTNGRGTTFANCTFVDNAGPDGSPYGGVIFGGYMDQNYLYAVNSAFVDHGPLVGSLQPHLQNDLVWSTTGEYAADAMEPLAGSSVVTNDPKFACMPVPFDWTRFDGRPKLRTSPLVNGGDSSRVLDGEVDFAGGPRVLDDVVDIGCYETLRASLPGDGTLLMIR